MRLILQRTDQNEHRTFGRIEREDGSVVVPWTLEEPWRENQRGISCIPQGTFVAFLRKCMKNGGTGHRSYDVPELKGVPQRSNVQLHVGNRLSDTEGCVLVGKNRVTSEDAMITGSRPAFDDLMEELEGVSEWMLEVRNP